MQEEKLARNEIKIVHLDSRVKGVERRINNVEQKLQREVERSISSDNEIKELVTALRTTLLEVADKNHITEFFKENWKYIAVWVTLTLGGDVKELVQFIAPLGAG